MLSRFRSQRADATSVEAAEGKIDILIGTHKPLLQSDASCRPRPADVDSTTARRAPQRANKAMRADVDILTSRRRRSAGR
ncbi:hypothetical protein KCP71_21475 [Salmonella enterica subsp. enterica]|nr:hypothetical protein KCP71_21475 [Salmonella enterica subsp. enterica]